MARAIRGLWEWNPKASRVSRRSLVLAASSRAIGRPWSSTSWKPDDGADGAGELDERREA